MTDKIILGTVQFGLDYGIHNSSGKPSFDVVTNILTKAYQNNIRFLDSAEVYGNAHEIIGEFHKKHAARFGIVTKYSSSRKDLPEDLEARILKNLETLQVKSLYAYMFHSFVDFENNYLAFQPKITRLKEKGLIGKFGVSVYTNEELAKLIGYAGIDIVQLPFNLLDNNFQRGALIKEAKQKGIEIHTRSAFLQGLFFEDLKKLSAKFSDLLPYLEEIKALSENTGIDLSTLALQYCVQQEMIDYVLIGVDNIEQLDKNIDALHRNIPKQTFYDVDSIKVENLRMLNPSNWNK
ncbi:MAG: aldo/keto reductase [Bacteroidia bacterium]|nr:aldo/keto reductase [Bacteroidia bacterium]